MNIVLMGMPGCGKTTVSAEIAALSFRALEDTDAIITKKHGDISSIFAKFGEGYFRALETEALKEAASSSNAVIATGGGCLMRDENVKIAKSCGKIVYLRTQTDTLCRRLEGDNSRPLLKGGTKKRLEELINEREKDICRSPTMSSTRTGSPPKR